MRRLRLIPIIAALAVSSAARAQATTPQPFLASISPVAAQVGTTVELGVTGGDLDGATRLHFSAPGVTCEPKLDDKKQSVPNRFVVTIPQGLPAQVCDVRVVARYGISNPRGFAITRFPVSLIPPMATSADKAFAARLNSVVTGPAVKQGSCFIKFDAKRGQRVVAVCQPLALDSRMDAYATLRGADGARLGRLQPDGLLDFTASADGSFILEVHDLMFRGDAEFPFTLALTTGPVVERAFDGGAQWTLYGRNLPKGTGSVPREGASMQRVQVPAEEAKKLLAENPIAAARFGAEADAPSAAPQPVALKVPATYAGWFAPQGQARAFTFEAKKGDAFWIEINSASQGLATDPILVVEKGGTFIAEANDRSAVGAKGEFDPVIADPAYRFEAKEDGTYTVKVRDLFTNGPQEPFELTIRPAGGDFDLVAVPVGPPKAKGVTSVEIAAAPLWRGGVALLKVYAMRRGGFNDAIELAADGLPPDVKFLGGLIREGQGAGYAAFYAEENAGEWAGAVKLHGKSGGPAHGATLQFKVGNTARESVLTRLTDEVVLGVTPSDAPVTIEPESPVVESDGGAKLSIPLKVTRRGDCVDALKLASVGIDGLAADIPAKATGGKLEVDVAKLKLPPGDHLVALQAIVKFKHKRGDDPKAAAKEMAFLVHSKPVTIRVKAPEKKP